ncbi:MULTISPECIES: endonuclease domain-containing protein [unclassified Brevundimonas]|uniref:endonuclease domain-containing protein n=1 Tax=unclassified Brevundimonas TaxID=2622653 RepID=UPI003F8DC2E2
MRRALTPPEARLWIQVKRGGLEGLKFRRQHPVGPYILDFYCHAARLAVEVDGAGHDDPEQIAHDERRTHWLASQGVEVLRVRSTDVRDHLEGVLAVILQHATGR